MEMRLSKWLAAAGVASRRECEKLIFEGKVTVNGIVAKQPQMLVRGDETIKADGKWVETVEKKYYFILNKPRGHICTNVGRKRVIDLFREVDARLFTIGRLDRDTEGLLLVTNDGHFSQKVIHPSSNVEKEYLVKTDHEIIVEHLKKIKNGAVIEDIHIVPISVKKVRRGTLKIVVAEGKKREVRKLVENAGLKVLALKRIRIGGLHLGELPEGRWRPLTDVEKDQIFE